MLYSGNYNVSKNLNQKMGNCAGAKAKPTNEPNPKQLDKSSHNVNQAGPKVEANLSKQQIVGHHGEPKSGHQNQHPKEQHKSEEMNIVGSLQIESAKKEIVNQVHHHQIKESVEAAVQKAKSDIAELKESAYNHQFTFQNSGEQEQTVAEENVGNFKNNNVQINFEIRAN